MHVLKVYLENSLWEDKAFNFAKTPKHDWYLRDLSSIVYNIFDKRSADCAIKSKIKSNQQSTDEVHKLIIINKFKKYKAFFF